MGLLKSLLCNSCLLILILFSGGSSHKFYVSLTEIKLVPDQKSIQVSIRIFPDDMDDALEKIHGSNPQIGTELENSEGDKWLEEYLLDHFSLKGDSINYIFTYLGKENEADAIWCYMESSFSRIPSVIEVTNSILTDIFEDQKNIIQFYYNDFNKGLLLDRLEPQKSIRIQ